MRPAAADDLIESAAGSHQYETTARVMCRAARAAGLPSAGRPTAVQALGTFSDHQRTRWQGTTHLRIAETHLAAGSPAEAARHAEEALVLGCVGGDRARADVLTLLGRALSQLGQQDRATACWYEALHLYEQQGGAAETDEVRALLTAAAA